MHQASQLEIAGVGEYDLESLSLREGRSGHARRTSEGNAAGCEHRRDSRRECRAAGCKRSAILPGYEKRYSVDFVRVDGPGDVVARVNPDFIGKEGERLASLIVTLCADGGVPLGLRYGRVDQDRKGQSPAQNC
jgi:hypothetical protein